MEGEGEGLSDKDFFFLRVTGGWGGDWEEEGLGGSRLHGQNCSSICTSHDKPSL